MPALSPAPCPCARVSPGGESGRVCECVRDGRPGPISLVVAANTPSPPVVARGNLAPPPASANQGQLCNLASPPLSAPSRPENPITLPTSHSPAPYPLPVCRGSSTDLPFPLPAPRFTCRLVFRQLRLRLTKINSRARSCSGRVCPVLSCPVIRSSGFYPGGSLPLESLGPLCLSLLSLTQQPPPLA